jgi:hypothetical protein
MLSSSLLDHFSLKSYYSIVCIYSIGKRAYRKAGRQAIRQGKEREAGKAGRQ